MIIRALGGKVANIPVVAPYTPSSAGVYRLPHDVRDRLAAALAPYRNRDAAFALATFLARFWKRAISSSCESCDLASTLTSGVAATRLATACSAAERSGMWA